MTYRINNFDQSSTGVNIESFCSYDNWLSQDYWRENFESCKGEKTRFGGDEVYYYIDYGNLPNRLETMDYKIIGAVKNLRRFLKIEGEGLCYLSPSDINKNKKAELIDDCMEIIMREYDLKLCNMDEINNWLHDYSLELKPEYDLIRVEIRGYSQGDYAEVLYCPIDCMEIWGKIPSETELKELFERYFYDAPIDCRVIINDDEFYYSDIPELKDEWTWDRDAWIEYVKKETGHDISNMVPEYPDYK